jgi:nucleotide-binding universal stress UspA family protein
VHPGIVPHRGCDEADAIGNAKPLQRACGRYGVIARGRLREMLIGSTAERVLDCMPCDILVVKTPGGDSAM